MLLVDTGPLVAAADRSDDNHEASRELLASAPGPLVVPMLVIAETAYLLMRQVGGRAESAFAQSLDRGDLLPEPFERADGPRIIELLDRDVDLELGVTVSSVISACERLDQTRLATLDRRDFSAVRPRHCEALELLPA